MNGNYNNEREKKIHVFIITYTRDKRASFTERKKQNKTKDDVSKKKVTIIKRLLLVVVVACLLAGLVREGGVFSLIYRII